MDRFTIGRIILVIVAVLVFLIFLVPFLSEYGTLVYLDGSVGQIDHDWGSVDPLSGLVYGLGDMLCHQQYVRSPILNGNQLPFCYRDLAIFIGVIIGFIITDRKLGYIDLYDRRVFLAGVVLIIIGLAAWLVEDIVSGDVVILRVVTGAMAGIGIALVIQCVISREFRKVIEEKV